jgi:hypothetical protein
VFGGNVIEENKIVFFFRYTLSVNVTYVEKTEGFGSGRIVMLSIHFSTPIPKTVYFKMKESAISHCKIHIKNKYARNTIFRHIFTCFQSMLLVVCLKNAFEWGSQYNNNAQQDKHTPSYQHLFICAVFNATYFDFF